MLTIGNITTSCITQKGFKKVTQAEIINSSLSAQIKKTNEQKMKSVQTNKKPKKKISGKVFASGSSSKTKLASLKRKLEKKLSEILTNQDGEDDKFKELKAARIRSQIEAIDRMLNGIKQAEQEKEIEKKRKKKSKESIWIDRKDLKTKDPLEKYQNENTSAVGQFGFPSSVISTPPATTDVAPAADAVVEGDIGSNVDISL